MSIAVNQHKLTCFLKSTDIYQPEWLLWSRYSEHSILTVSIVVRMCDPKRYDLSGAYTPEIHKRRATDFLVEFINYRQLGLGEGLAEKFLAREIILARLDLTPEEAARMCNGDRRPLLLLARNPNLQLPTIKFLHDRGVQRFHWDLLVKIPMYRGVRALKDADLFTMMMQSPHTYPFELADRVAPFGAIPCNLRGATAGLIVSTHKRYHWDIVSFCARTDYTYRQLTRILGNASDERRAEIAPLVCRNCIGTINEILTVVPFNWEIMMNVHIPAIAKILLLHDLGEPAAADFICYLGGLTEMRDVDPLIIKFLGLGVAGDRFLSTHHTRYPFALSRLTWS